MSQTIKISNLCYSYPGKQQALDHIELEIKNGEIFSIIGSNGCGKSTLFHLMAGLIFPQKGIYLFDEKEINENSLKDSGFNNWFRSRIGYVFQNSESQLFCSTVWDELLFGPQQMQLAPEEANNRAHSVLELLGIVHLKNRPSFLLSGGEKKKVAIGSVLTMNPDVILLDEPLNGLDPKTRAFVIELLIRLNSSGKTIILATHHLELVEHLESRVAVLSEEHKVLKTGNYREILTDTDLLIRANLIHENWHKHGYEIHKHITFKKMV